MREKLSDNWRLFRQPQIAARVDAMSGKSFLPIMDENTELTALRDMRDITFAIRDLENQLAAVSKRYKRGIKTLEREVAATEQALDEGVQIDGCEPWNSRSDQLKALISNPTIENIEEDLKV